MGDKKRNKYLLKNTIIFAIGNFATKFMNFFLVPLYTGCMAAAEYGTADFLYTICSFLAPLLTLNIAEAVLMFSLDRHADEKKIMCIATSMIIPLVIFGALSIPILQSIDMYRDYAVYFYAYLVSSAVAQIYLVALKGQEKLKMFTAGNIIHTATIVVFNLIFLLGFRMGIVGYFLAYIVSNIIVALYAFIASKAYRYLKDSIFDKTLFKRMVKYSVLIIPTTFMWWIMSFLDRAMITNMMGAADSGIYAISYKIPTILSSVSSIFMQAWLFSAVKNQYSQDNERYSNRVFGMLAFILAFTSIALLIIVKQLFSFYVAPEYYSAWEYVPVLMLGHIFLTLSTFISTSYNVHKDSKGFLFSATAGAVINLVLNAVLIPSMGVQGAAIATTISYIGVFIYRLFDTKKYVKMRINLKFIANIALVIAVAGTVYIQPIWLGLIFQIIAVVNFIIVNWDDVKSVLAAFGKILKIKTFLRNRKH